MSFENGYNMFNYCGELFLKYTEDDLIFYKTLQVLDSFKQRNDYPYCSSELSSVCERMLGYNLEWVTDFLWKYTIRLSDKMIWDARNVLPTKTCQLKNLVSELPENEGDKLVSNFKKDMEVFFITMTPLFEDLFMGEVPSSRIDKIALKHTYGEEKSVRIIRKDGEVFNFSVTKNDIEKIVDVFSHME